MSEESSVETFDTVPPYLSLTENMESFEEDVDYWFSDVILTAPPGYFIRLYSWGHEPTTETSWVNYFTEIKRYSGAPYSQYKKSFRVQHTCDRQGLLWVSAIGQSFESLGMPTPSS